MPLTLSVFSPHSPILIPRIGKDHSQLLTKTSEGLQEINKNFCNDTPETIIILSPHSDLNTETFNINLSSEYYANLNEFGDLITENKWQPDLEMINTIRHKSYSLYDINMFTSKTFDYGSAIPLIFFTENLPKIKIVPISFSKIPLPEVYRFGQFLSELIFSSDKKISIVASGDLSHRLTKESPNGYSPQAKVFDQQIITCINKNNIQKLTKFSDKLLTEVGQCGIRSLLILAGAISKKNAKPKILSYEAPFGIGYLLVAFELQPKG